MLKPLGTAGDVVDDGWSIYGKASKVGKGGGGGGGTSGGTLGGTVLATVSSGRIEIAGLLFPAA